MTTSLHNNATASLLNWQVAVSQTDTVWGIVAKLSQKNYSRIYEIKGRDENKALIIFAQTIAELKNISEGWDSKIESIAQQYFPGALTIIMPRSKALPDWINPGIETIGMRIPNSPSVLKLLASTEEGLLLSTSANFSGESPVANYDSALEKFSNKVDLILKPEASETISGEASTIISYINGEVKVLRQGTIKITSS